MVADDCIVIDADGAIGIDADDGGDGGGDDDGDDEGDVCGDESGADLTSTCSGDSGTTSTVTACVLGPTSSQKLNAEKKKRSLEKVKS